ncbi:uncharacterized protein, partial [Anolis sagrei]|uniref:uncharacterized protein n=1 Tax=Anolis sagrei TaxID=38937 RepID=UPI0035204633
WTKLVRMETQQIYKRACPALANSDKLLETSAEIKDETEVKIHCHFQKDSSHPVLLSHLTYNETSMEFTKDICSLYADGKSTENQTDGELLYPSDCNGVGDQTQPPSHLLPKSSSDERSDKNHEINLFKKKQNTGSCSDIQLSSPRNNCVFQVDEMTNIDVSSSEDQEDEEEEDIFTELPVNETALESTHKTYLFQARGDRYHRISDKCHLPPVIGCSDCNQKTPKEYKMHVKVLETWAPKESILQPTATSSGCCVISVLTRREDSIFRSQVLPES